MNIRADFHTEHYLTNVIGSDNNHIDNDLLRNVIIQTSMTQVTQVSQSIPIVMMLLIIIR